MDEHRKRQILQKAHAILDRREQDAWEHRQWRERHRDRYGILDLGEDEASDILQDKPATRDADLDRERLIYKTFHNETPAPQPQPQPQSPEEFVAENGFNELQQAVLVEIIAEMRAEWQKDIEESAQRKAGNVEQLIRKKDVA